MASGDGTVLSKNSFFPYGQRIPLVSAAAGPRRPDAFSPFGFNDRRKERKGDLIYYGARYYDPFTRQFISVDPLREAGADDSLAGNPLQPYVYAGANPTTFVDPDGRMLKLPYNTCGTVDPTDFAHPTPIAGAAQIGLKAAIKGLWRAGKWVVTHPRHSCRVLKAAVKLVIQGPSATKTALERAAKEGQKLLPHPRGNPSPSGQQGPFRVTPDGQAVPPINKFEPGDMVRHPQTGSHGKVNYGTKDPASGKFKEKVAVHPAEPGKGPKTHGGQDHYHLNRNKKPIFAPKED